MQALTMNGLLLPFAIPISVTNTHHLRSYSILFLSSLPFTPFTFTYTHFTSRISDTKKVNGEREKAPFFWYREHKTTLVSGRLGDAIPKHKLAQKYMEAKNVRNGAVGPQNQFCHVHRENEGNSTARKIMYVHSFVRLLLSSRRARNKVYISYYYYNTFVTSPYEYTYFASTIYSTTVGNSKSHTNSLNHVGRLFSLSLSNPKLFKISVHVLTSWVKSTCKLKLVFHQL
jgi:hypothetical protein